MPQCPICGKETNEPREITVKNNRLVNLCSVCHSYLICLVKPVSVNAKKSARDWAQEYMQKNQNLYIQDILSTCYNYSLVEDSQDAEKILPPVVIQKSPPFSGQNIAQQNTTGVASVISQPPINSYSCNYPYIAQPAVKTKYTGIVKIMVYISLVLFMIGGGALGAISDEIIGIILGALGGLLVGLITNSVIMMLVETAENTAIAARTALRNEQLLEEIRISQKNSQK